MGNPTIFGANNLTLDLQNGTKFNNGIVVKSGGPPNYVAGDFDAGLGSWSLATVSLSGINPTGSITASAASLSALSLQTTGTLAGVQSLQVASTAAWSAGQGIYIPFTIDAGQQAQMQQIQFLYNVTAGSANCNFSNSSSSTFAIGVYDVTNSAWVSITPAQYGAFLGSKGAAKVSFQASSNSVSYQLIIFAQVASTGAVTMLVDQVQVGPQSFSGYAPIMTAPVAYTPAVVGWGAPTGLSFTYAQNGKFCIIQGTLTAGTSTAVQAQIPLPNGIVIDPSVVTNFICGKANINYSISTYFGTGVVLCNAGNNFLQLGVEAYGFNSLSPANGNVIVPSGYTISVWAMVPILGWSSSSQILSQYDGRAVSAQVTGTPAAYSSLSPIIWPTVSYDSHGAYNTSTGQYLCTVGGVYTVTTTVGNNNGNGSPIYVYRNNGQGPKIAVLLPQSTSVYASGAAQILANAGDLLDIRDTSSSSVISAGNASFSLNSGSQQIMASQTIAARYYASATAISGTPAIIVWTTKDYDTTGNSVVSGVWTAPASGKAKFSVAIEIAGTFVLNSTVDLQVLYNGSVKSEVVQYAGGAMTNIAAYLGDTYNVNAGDTIQVQVSSSGTLPTIVSSNSKNYFTIRLS